MSIYDASVNYREARVPLIVLAGKEYGSGSSRDWAAKGHDAARRQSGHCRELRANSPQQSRQHGRVAARVPGRESRPTSLGLTGQEVFDLIGSGDKLKPRGTRHGLGANRQDRSKEFKVIVRVDTPEELTAYRHGGILPVRVEAAGGK